jgi:hypothetical protein
MRNPRSAISAFSSKFPAASRRLTPHAPRSDRTSDTDDGRQWMMDVIVCHCKFRGGSREQGAGSAVATDRRPRTVVSPRPAALNPPRPMPGRRPQPRPPRPRLESRPPSPARSRARARSGSAAGRRRCRPMRPRQRRRRRRPKGVPCRQCRRIGPLEETSASDVVVLPLRAVSAPRPPTGR